MSLFHKKPDPFSDELKKLEQESRLVEEKLRRLQHELGQPAKDPIPVTTSIKQFQGAMFKDNDLSPEVAPQKSATLKVQRRKLRNRAIILGVVLMILILLVLKTLNY